VHDDLGEDLDRSGRGVEGALVQLAIREENDLVTLRRAPLSTAHWPIRREVNWMCSVQP